MSEQTITPETPCVSPEPDREEQLLSVSKLAEEMSTLLERAEAIAAELTKASRVIVDAMKREEALWRPAPPTIAQVREDRRATVHASGPQRILTALTIYGRISRSLLSATADMKYSTLRTYLPMLLRGKYVDENTHGVELLPAGRAAIISL